MGKTKRLDHIVILRALAIVLVVAGHSLVSIDAPDPHMYMPVRTLVSEVFLLKYIYSFHMPLFFWIAGYIFCFSASKKGYGFRLGCELGRKVTRLLIPMFATTLFFMVPAIYLWGHPKPLADMVKMVLFARVNGHLWFLKSLFYIFLVVIPCFSLLKRLTLHRALFLVLGLFLISCQLTVGPQFIMAFLTYLPFFLLGFFSQKFQLNFKLKNELITFGFFWLVHLFIFVEGLFYPDFGANKGIYFVKAITGTYFMFYLAQHLSKISLSFRLKGAFNVLDKSSYSIYLFHVSFIYLLMYLFSFSPHAMPIGRIAPAILLGLLCPIIIHILLSKNRYTAFLFSMPFARTERGNKSKSKSKENILYISNTGEIIGGGEISLLNLLANLDRTRYSPLVAIPEEGELSRRLKDIEAPFTVIKLPSLRSGRIDLIFSSIFNFRRIFKEYDISLAHANGSRAMLLGGIAANLFGLPAIWHLRISERTEVLYDRFLLALSSKVIAISSAVVSRLSWTFWTDKITLVHNGVNTSIFNPQNRLFRQETCESLRLDHKLPVVTTMCQLTAMKHVEVFIEAAAEVLSSHPETQFVIVGREPAGSEGYKQKLIELTKYLAIEKNVHFAGFRNDPQKILAASDIFVLTSVGEAFGRVIIEAMSSGTPVVATNTGGIPDIIKHGDTGFLFREGQAQEGANYIVRLLDDENLKKSMAAKGRERAVNNFSIESHARNIESCYQQLLS